MGPSNAVGEARAWLSERRDPAFPRGPGSTALRAVTGVQVPVKRSHPRPAERPAGDLAPLRVMVQTEDDVVRVCPFGAVDIGTVGELREQLENAAAAGKKHVVLDLRCATFLDSAGLHLVLEADAASRAQGWEFELAGGPPDVQRVFDLTGARARLPFLTASELAALLTAPDEAPA